MEIDKTILGGCRQAVSVCLCVKSGDSVVVVFDTSCYFAIRNFAAKLYEILAKAETMAVRAPAGTSVVAEFSPDIRWVNMDGFITRDTHGTTCRKGKYSPM